MLYGRYEVVEASDGWRIYDTLDGVWRGKFLARDESYRANSRAVAEMRVRDAMLMGGEVG